MTPGYTAPRFTFRADLNGNPVAATNGQRRADDYLDEARLLAGGFPILCHRLLLVEVEVFSTPLDAVIASRRGVERWRGCVSEESYAEARQTTQWISPVAVNSRPLRPAGVAPRGRNIRA